MIADARILLRNVIERCAVDPPREFEWFGRRIAVSGGEGGEDDAWRSFLRTLAIHLYVHVYCPGEVISRQLPPRDFSAAEIRALLRGHSLANPDRDRWDTGWTYVGKTRSAFLVRKDGLDFTVASGGFRPRGNAPLRDGCSVRVLVPSERWFRSPGYMLFYGRRVPRPRAAAIPRTRLYLDLDVAGARQVIGLCRRFNDARLPFTLKVAGHPAAYDRCDTVILFIERDDYIRASEILTGAAMEFRARLRARIPAFTKGLAPGVGVSDDPPSGESFGESRCRLLAEGIVRAHDSGAGTVESRLRKIEETFLREGISLDRPNLEPGSLEYDPGLWSHWPVPSPSDGAN